MAPWYVAIILGIVEGLTEFLPVSSTGHLIITGYLLDFTGPKAETFEIVIQLGAILAVVALYWDRFIGLLATDPERKFSGVYGLWLLFLTSLPASVVGLLAHGYIKEHLFSPGTVAVALAVGAVLIFVVEGMNKRIEMESLDEITPKLALGIGLFQCLALWPGFSRSASTIMGGMLLGAGRTVAAEYSFIAAVPIMFAATGYDFLKNYELFEHGDMLFLLLGFLVSFIAAWIAVKGFIILLGRLTLRPFAVYRLGLAVLILLFL
ncbi:undecaprenyl-diphosphate phosphatase [Pseudodesulfovibrio indicus]|uniref:Undecaprenyl-diphosphatase n=1 Tax=Pseudodesulfovibrio indicus TaxID=1716143 RepID=A0A126QPG1_9BACT|nr:undecaprenyl-diphosphate phosphatase [Pseudodesulfovibrio indicus]AMK11821.1 undecaprenyl-diphosphatase [Pseudodesulfovibrio indicus]TDT88363.1 undecaprenyl-diphosphatase [Pseudodesulfovibrio indicus]